METKEKKNKKDVYIDHFKYLNITHIIFFSLLVLSWILLIVTFSGTTFWYKYEDNGIKVQWRFNEVRIDVGSDNKYIATYTKYGSHEASIFKACISFTILSFVVVNVLLILILIQIIGATGEQKYIDSQILKKSIRFIPIISFFFAFLSILICLGFNKAYEKDCEKSTTCYQSIFNGGFIGSSNGKYWGPGVGWITSLIATIFLFFASILAVINYRNINNDNNSNYNNNNNDENRNNPQKKNYYEDGANDIQA
ncbi:hypothetical protein RB653_006818 [Dictyostelium firmibasis]|uniref:Transmembrane protein n=1 Tax=Dictyostelium firmibasis TaxID=79012 RepID=A0AAN7U072_9MYCE